MQKTYGFTLIELSIVLVIIGLIVGGVLVGRDLIATSQLRAQVTQFEKYNQAVNTFKGKYNCLPGDCSNFTSFFPSFSPGQTFGTANGDGDGSITEANNGSCCNTSGFPYEVYPEPVLFFMQLFTAGLSQCCTPDGTDFFIITIGKTFPQDKVNGYGITASNMLGRNGYFWGIKVNMNNSGNNFADYVRLNGTAGVTTPAQAKAFDSKVDDGLALTGNVFVADNTGDNRMHPLTFRTGADGCLVNTTPASYDLTTTIPACFLWINMN